MVSSTTPQSSAPGSGDTNEQFQQAWEKVYTFLAGLPEYLSDFFEAYRRPLITLGLIFGSIVSVKLVLALLGAINEIPLLAPTFELIGFSYTAWFIYRYVWRAGNRKEFLEQLNSYREEILGSNKDSSKL